MSAVRTDAADQHRARGGRREEHHATVFAAPAPCVKRNVSRVAERGLVRHHAAVTHIPILDELAVIAALGVAIAVVLAKLRVPTVAGLLAAGALLGPYGLALVHSVHAIQVLAEVGVVLLLFTTGLEFSFERLAFILRRVALGGVLQVALTCGATAAVAVGLGASPGRGVFYGFVVAMSSTAIVLRALDERHETEAPHGRFIVGTLIFQDLCVIPMLLVVPLLAVPSGAASVAADLALALGKTGVVVLVTWAAARFVVPTLLAWVEASRSREVFLLAVLAVCIGTAWLTSMAGLSLALGAFLGGLVVADTEHGHRALGDVLPLRHAFVSVFFVSLGMLFDPRVLADDPTRAGLLFLAFVFGKAALATLAALAMRFPARVAWLAGVGLAQFGEFGFVLTRLGEANGLVDADETRALLAAGIASMFLTPLLVRAAPHFRAGERLLAPLERVIGVRAIDEASADVQALSGHVVIVGYGIAGRLAAAALDACAVPYLALELNAETVRKAKTRGERVYYGDATSEEALGHAHLARARALVLVMSDPQATRRIVDAARRVASAVPIFVRTRYQAESLALRDAGAREVVAEEVEGGVELIDRLLHALGLGNDVVSEQTRLARRSVERT